MIEQLVVHHAQMRRNVFGLTMETRGNRNFHVKISFYRFLHSVLSHSFLDIIQ